MIPCDCDVLTFFLASGSETVLICRIEKPMSASALSQPRCSGRGPSRAAAHGFSLIELLAVIAIISILMTMGLVGVKNLAAGKGTTAAVASVEAIFEEARLTASSKATTARVLVSIDPTQGGFLRQVLVAFRPIDPNTNLPDTSKWELSSRGYLIPDGVYFSRKYSSVKHPGGGAVPDESMTFPQVNYNGKYSYYEFNAEGICESPGASFLIASGALPKTSAGGDREPRTTGSAKRDFGGFVVWRNGRTSVFRNADHADIPASVDKF